MSVCPFSCNIVWENCEHTNSRRNFNLDAALLQRPAHDKGSLLEAGINASTWSKCVWEWLKNIYFCDSYQGVFRSVNRRIHWRYHHQTRTQLSTMYYFARINTLPLPPARHQNLCIHRFVTIPMRLNIDLFKEELR